MWGQDKQDTKQAIQTEPEKQTESSTSVSDGQADIAAYVGKGVEFRGTISYSGTVRIDGVLDGEIETDGALLIGEEAVIHAKVTAGTIICKGQMTGDVVARDRVKLRAPAIFSGNIKTSMLSIEDGVIFNGGLEMRHAALELPLGIGLHSVGVAS